MNTLLSNRFRITSGRCYGLAKGVMLVASIMLVLLLLALTPLARAANIEPLGQLPNGLGTRFFIKDHYTVLCWNNQVTVLDMSNPLKPRRVSQVALPDGAYTVNEYTLSGNRLFAIQHYYQGWSWLTVIDLTNPEAPVMNKSWLGVGLIKQMVMAGNLACFSYGGFLSFIDLTAPDKPVWYSYYYASNIFDVAMSGSLACLATYDGLRVLDISNPTSPTQLSFVPRTFTTSVKMAGDRVYVNGYNNNGLAIFSLADPAHPVQLNPQSLPNVSCFTLVDHWLYCFEWQLFGSDWPGRLQIYDVTDPANPVPHGRLDVFNFNTNVMVAQDGYLWMGAVGDGLDLVDIHDPDHPAWAGSYLPGQCVNASFSGHWAFLQQKSGLLPVDLTDPAAPVMGDLYRLPHIVSMARDGNNLYIADAPTTRTSEVMILDATDPTRLTVKGRCPIDAPYMNSYLQETTFRPAMQAANGLVLAPKYDGNFQLIDARSPATPKAVGALVWSTGQIGISYRITQAAFGPPNRVYATVQRGSSGQSYSTDQTLLIYDISNPAAPRVINTMGIGSVDDLKYRDGMLYVLNDQSQTLTFDVRDADHPRLLDLFPSGANTIFASEFFNIGDRRVGLRDRSLAYANFTFPRETLDLLDLTDFAHPTLLGRLPNFMAGGGYYASFHDAGNPAILLNSVDLSLYRLRADAVPLAILAPASKTQVTGGDQLPVHWRIDKQAAGTAVRFALIDYYDKATTLGEGVAASGETTTTLRIPVLPVGSYRLRATSTAKPEITAESLLTIDIAGTGVGLFAPAGGETYHPGQTINVDWEGYPAITGAQVRFELWRGWTKVCELGTAAVGDGETHTPFTLPANLEPDTNYVLLVVSQTNEAVFARNPGSFTIAK